MEFSDLKAQFNLLNEQEEEHTIFQCLKTQGKPAHPYSANLRFVFPPELLLQKVMGALRPFSHQKCWTGQEDLRQWRMLWGQWVLVQPRDPAPRAKEGPQVGEGDRYFPKTLRLSISCELTQVWLLSPNSFFMSSLCKYKGILGTRMFLSLQIRSHKIKLSDPGVSSKGWWGLWVLESTHPIWRQQPLLSSPQFLPCCNLPQPPVVFKRKIFTQWF